MIRVVVEGIRTREECLMEGYLWSESCPNVSSPHVRLNVQSSLTEMYRMQSNT